MNVYVKCERCAAEQRPEWRGSTQQQGLNYQGCGDYSLPLDWVEICGHVLCGACAQAARMAVDDLVRSPGRGA